MSIRECFKMSCQTVASVGGVLNLFAKFLYIGFWELLALPKLLDPAVDLVHLMNV
jgi:hypothetical protein